MKGMKSVDRRRADCTPLHPPGHDCGTPAVGLEQYKPTMQLLLLPLLLPALVAGQKLCLDTETQMAICYTRTAPWGIRRTRLWRSALPSSGWSDLLLYFIPKTLQCQNFIVGPFSLNLTSTLEHCLFCTMRGLTRQLLSSLGSVLTLL